MRSSSFSLRSVLCCMLLALVASISATWTTSSKVQAADYCQCVDFVNRHAGLSISGNANTWSSSLPSKGYSKTSSPSAGDIVVFSQAEYDRNGTMLVSPNGHVGFFEGFNTSSYIKVWGANQLQSKANPWTTVDNCSDVNTVQFPNFSDGSVSFWHKGSAPASTPPPPAPTPTPTPQITRPHVTVSGAPAPNQWYTDDASLGWQVTSGSCGSYQLWKSWDNPVPNRGAATTYNGPSNGWQHFGDLGNPWPTGWHTST